MAGRRGRRQFEDDAERRGRHSHAERGNELMAGSGADGSSKMTRSVADGIPTQSVGTS